jgi:hypothetical protein
MRAAKLCVLVFYLLAIVQAGARSHQEAPPAPEQIAPARPFAVGERLVYAVKWDPPWYLFFLPAMEAGEVDLRLAGETEYKGKKAWRIEFKAHSSGGLATMSGVKIEDEFVFIVEPETFCSLSISKKIREGKRRRQIDVEYLRETGQLHIREIDESTVPPKLKKDEIKDGIPSCLQDPVSAIYLLRQSELKPQHERTYVIGYDDRVKQIRTRVEKRETVQTPAGTFSSWSIKTEALMGGLFKEGGQFRLWVSADQQKVPLQFEVKVSLGKVVGKLKTALH